MKTVIDGQKYRLYTAQSRPELWKQLEDERHPLNTSWPLFLDQDTCYKKYCSRLSEYDGLQEFQFAIVEQDLDCETIVACGRSIPFYWPELDEVGGRSRYQKVLHSLPDGGYDSILTRGVQQYLRRQGLVSKTATGHHANNRDDACYRSDLPNALSAISITVHPDRRSLGLAEAMIQAMKQTAKAKNLDILVVPLRPTRKSEYPLVDMAEYITWLHQPGALDQDLPFDPWLRKHVRLGGQFVKIAWSSMRVEGTITDWRQWTCCNEWRTLPIKWDSDSLFVDVEFPGGLVPLRVYLQEDCAVYVEPNVWIYHDPYV